MVWKTQTTPRMVRVVPIAHPASILKGRWKLAAIQEAYIRRAREAQLGKREWPDHDINEPPPRTKLFPTVREIQRFTDDTLGTGGRDGFHGRGDLRKWTHLSCDIENAGPHIICIGLAQLSLDTDEVGDLIVVRFRKRGGDCYWSSRDDLLSVVGYMDSLLGDPAVGLVFHNGVTHDVPILEDIGFNVRGALVDTMLLQHTAYSEQPKGLQFTATLHCWAPNWKTLTKPEDEEDGKG